MLLPVALTVAPEARGQTGGSSDPFPVDVATRVASVDFRFDGPRSLPRERLRQTVALKDPRVFTRLVRGLAGTAVGALDRPAQLFEPVEMMRDLERLRRLYAREGFPGAEVGHRLRVDEERNTVAVTFHIREGPPVRITGVDAVDSAGLPLPQTLAADVAEEWPSASRTLASFVGRRFSEPAAAEIERAIETWLGDRGYVLAVATARSDQAPGSLTADVGIVTNPGPRLRVDSIDITGTERLRRQTILDELPLQKGEWLSTRDLVQGRREIMGLDLVRLAIMGVAPESDSTARVEIEVQEGPLRLIEADLGYASETGPALSISWSHRDFFGRARTFTVEGRANTGSLALVERPDKMVWVGASLRQPRLFDRRTSLTTSVFAEVSDNEISRSRRLGGQSTLVFVGSRALTVGLDVRLARRWVDEYRLGAALTQGIDLITLLTRGAEGVLDELGAQVREGEVSLEAVIGPEQRDLGRDASWSLRPRVAVSAPPVLSDIQYVRFDANARASRRIFGELRVQVRASAGHLEPFGSSLPANPDDGLGKFLRLRPALFTAGGSGDVRGWGSSLLGPKFPELRFSTEGDSVRLEGRAFTPLGGTNRVTASLQVDTPVPFTPEWLSALLFVDGGRIWTPDPRFGEDDGLGQNRFFWAAGAGVAVGSPVGRIELAAGVKLNPTVLDLAAPTDVLQALVEDRPLDDVPTLQRRRIQLHLSIGAGR